jgi:transmembrane 9 superfamily protein 2/4
MKKISILLLTVIICVVHGFYLPGLPTQVYEGGELARVKTRKLTSVHDLPFDFYSLQFCRPEPIQPFAENLGEYLFGDRIENSVYNVSYTKHMLTNSLNS